MFVIAVETIATDYNRSRAGDSVISVGGSVVNIVCWWMGRKDEWIGIFTICLHASKLHTHVGKDLIASPGNTQRLPWQRVRPHSDGSKGLRPAAVLRPGHDQGRCTYRYEAELTSQRQYPLLGPVSSFNNRHSTTSAACDVRVWA
ncbi:hypothetical protein LSAT2_009531 [Lamellibrachia satsuma]|nr:hypothetical protein LSAT2_009531 [Lamellibrachia satsuma]